MLACVPVHTRVPRELHVQGLRAQRVRDTWDAGSQSMCDIDRTKGLPRLWGLEVWGGAVDIYKLCDQITSCLSASVSPGVRWG